MDEQTIIHDVDRALAVDHSPDFRARVRARIANEPVPRERTYWAAIAAAASIAALALISHVVQTDPERVNDRPPRAQAHAAAIESMPRTAPIVDPELPRRDRRNVRPPVTGVNAIAAPTADTNELIGEMTGRTDLSVMFHEPLLTTELQAPPDAARWLEIDPTIHIMTIPQGARQ